MLLIAICDTTKERGSIFPFTLHLQHWSILDPNDVAGLADQETEAFRRVQDEIKDKVGQFIADTAQIKPSGLSIA
jgi:hypothetical protein